MLRGPIRFTNDLGGTADFIYPGPAIDMQSPASAGASNGTTYIYYAQSLDMSEWEVGSGAYTSASGTFARTTVIKNSLGDTTKINFANPPQVVVLDTATAFLTATDVREKLTAARTYYVRSDGSDSNTGLANTAGGAFLTLQKAMDTIAALDCSIYGVTVNVGAGTYAALILKYYVGSGTVAFVGDTATPANVIISAAGSSVSTSAAGGNFTLSGFRLQSSAAQDIAVGSYTTVTLDHIEYNGSSANYRIYASNYGRLVCSGANHKVLTGGLGLFLTELFGTIYINSSTFTFGASVTYSGATATARQIGYMETTSATFSLGAFTVTGQRYFYQNGGGFAGTGAAAGFFPGTVAGAAGSGGGFYS